VTGVFVFVESARRKEGRDPWSRRSGECRFRENERVVIPASCAVADLIAVTASATMNLASILLVDVPNVPVSFPPYQIPSRFHSMVWDPCFSCSSSIFFYHKRLAGKTTALRSCITVLRFYLLHDFIFRFYKYFNHYRNHSDFGFPFGKRAKMFT
jgi:hypothetical protein